MSSKDFIQKVLNSKASHIDIYVKVAMTYSESLNAYDLRKSSFFYLDSA